MPGPGPQRPPSWNVLGDVVGRVGDIAGRGAGGSLTEEARRLRFDNRRVATPDGSTGGGGVASWPPMPSNLVEAWWAEYLRIVLVNGFDGASITAWRGLRGSTSITASPPSVAPTLRWSGINGRAAVEFDGTQWLRRTNTTGIASSGRVIAVVALDALPGAGSPTIWSGNGNTASNLIRGFVANDRINIESQGQAGSHASEGSTPVTADSPMIIEWSQGQMRLNGAPNPATNFGTWFFSVERAWWSVGAHYLALTATDFLVGRIAYLAVLDGATDVGEYEQLYQWLSAYYSINLLT